MTAVRYLPGAVWVVGPPLLVGVCNDDVAAVVVLGCDAAAAAVAAVAVAAVAATAVAAVILVVNTASANNTATTVVGGRRCRHCARPQVYSIIPQRPQEGN